MKIVKLPNNYHVEHGSRLLTTLYLSAFALILSFLLIFRPLDYLIPLLLSMFFLIFIFPLYLPRVIYLEDGIYSVGYRYFMWLIVYLQSESIKIARGRRHNFLKINGSVLRFSLEKDMEKLSKKLD